MKLKLSCLLKGTLLLSVLAVSLLIKPNICLAAQSGSDPTELKKDTVYEYDLNGDGKTEKIQYKVTTDEDKNVVALKLYINDKLYLSRKDHGFLYNITICDLDKSDNYLDLYGYATMDSDCISNSFFARYHGKKNVDYIKFQPEKLTKYFNAIRYSLGTVDGNCKFNVIIDTPIFSDAIGCYYCNVPYQLKNNVASKVLAKIYTLTKYSKEYQYKVQKSFSVYDKVGSNTVVYTVNKGDKVTFDALYVTKSGKAYFRIVNQKGKKGWIKSDQENLFSNVPVWG